MGLRGEHLLLRPLEPADVPSLHALRLSERSFLEPWEPRRPQSFWTLEGQRAVVNSDRRQAERGHAYAFGIFLPGDDLIGRVVLSNVARGAWQNASLGYFVARAHNGRGYATEAVRLVLRFAFTEARLHRVQAAVMPRNGASLRVLEKAGFLIEGVSRNYLEINGVWEDHILFAVTLERFDELENGP